MRDPAGDEGESSGSERLRVAWLSLDASSLEGGADGQVAIVLQPVPADGLLDAVLRSHGLSAREREVAALAAAGSPDKAIAAALRRSPWTVADHLKAAYGKTGAGGRLGLSALVASSAPAGLAGG